MRLTASGQVAEMTKRCSPLHPDGDLNFTQSGGCQESHAAPSGHFSFEVNACLCCFAAGPVPVGIVGPPSPTL